MTSELRPQNLPLQNFDLELYSTDLEDLLEGVKDHCLVSISNRT